jgi:hypothetical protein
VVAAHKNEGKNMDNSNMTEWALSATVDVRAYDKKKAQTPPPWPGEESGLPKNSYYKGTALKWDRH